MQWYEIIGYITAFLLGVILIISTVVFFKHKDYSEGIAAFFVGCIIIVATFCSIYCTNFPSETIEVNGYIYELQEEPPEQYIKRGGHTYVLQGGEYDTNS